jgi:hypothetical protein
MTSGCTTKKITPLNVNTKQHSPVRLHIYEKPDPAHINQILILPPLGISDPGIRNRFHLTLYGAAQRRFTAPVKLIMADSAYSPYVEENNLLLSDGTINLEEVSIIGNLMNTSYVICPFVRELKPYHPQRIDIRLIVVDAALSKECVELSSVFDAQDNDVLDYFMEYSESHKNKSESTDDLVFKIKSPAAFQAFVADMCTSVMADKLPF